MTARDDIAAWPARAGPDRSGRGRRVVAIVSDKGGVGKTTLAHNLAVHARAVDANRPVLVIGLDGSAALDEMFAPDDARAEENTYTALQRGTFETAIRPGLHGVHYVPSSPRTAESTPPGLGRFVLQTALRRTAFPGLVVIDTHSDLGMWTQNAITASDLAVLPVSDLPSLFAAKRVFELLATWGEPSARARLALSMLDLRIRFQGHLCGDLLGLLKTTARRFELPFFESFIARSPRVQALSTNPEGRRYPILHEANRTDVQEQMAALTREILDVLERPVETSLEDVVVRSATRSLEPPPELVVHLRLRTPEAAFTLPFEAEESLCVREFPFYIGRQDPGVLNDLPIDDVQPWQISRRHAHLVQREGRVGVMDVGSQLGTWVDGRQLGGPTADPGPAWFDANGSVLILGDRRRSPYVFDVEMSEGVVAASSKDAVPLSPMRGAALAALAH